MAAWTAELKQRWDRRPEVSGPEWSFPMPDWTQDVPAANRLEDDWLRLYSVGRPVWGHVLMANNACWSNTGVVAPGEVLYSYDPFVQENPSWYRVPSERYWMLKKGKDTSAVGLRRLIHFSRDEQRNAHRLQLPPSLTNGRIVYLGMFFLFPRQIPGGFLQDGMVPLIAARHGDPPTVLIPPAPIWPESLRKRWEDAARSG